jgi:hypothetical protein
VSRIIESLEKATASSGVTSDTANLFDLQEYDIVIAIQFDRFYFLYMTGTFTFMPDGFARA